MLKHLRWLAAFMVLGVLMAVFYAPAPMVPLLYDDYLRLYSNPLLTKNGVSFDELFSFSRPLVDVLYMSAAHITGAGATGEAMLRFLHHINIIVHALAALLLMASLARAFGTAGSSWPPFLAAFVAAVFWMLHPLQTESVTYIYQGVEAMSGMFFFAVVYASMRYFESAAWKWSVLAVLCAVLGGGIKQTLMVAPLVVLLYDRCFVSGAFVRALRVHWRHYSLLGGALFAWFFFWGLKGDNTAGFQASDNPAHWYFFNQPAVILQYLKLVFLPVDLCFDYEWKMSRDIAALAPSIVAVAALLGAGLYALLKCSGARAGKAWSAAAFLTGWFFITLAPSSSLYPLKDLAVEHRMYLPLAAPAAALGLGVHRLVINWLKGRFGAPVVVAVAFVLLAALAGLGLGTYSRNLEYLNPRGLWEDVVRQHPRNARALSWVAYYHAGEGRLSDALKYYRLASEVDEDPVSVLNIGRIHDKLGDRKKALEYARKAIELNKKLVGTSKYKHTFQGEGGVKVGQTPEDLLGF